MCSVRGIGVAVSVSTSTDCAELLQPLLVRHAEPLLLVHDDQAQVAGTARPSRAAGACRSRCRPRRPSAPRRSSSAPRASGSGESISDLHRERGEPLGERVEVLLRQHGRRARARRPACPSFTALNAARIATSVLPKPTSPQTSRSIGAVALHVLLHVLDRRRAGRRVSWYGKRRLHLVLPDGVRAEGIARQPPAAPA